MKRIYFTCGYGGNASIQPHGDGSATLRFFNGINTIARKCKSVTSAKRTLSRWTDGLYKERTVVEVF